MPAYTYKATDQDGQIVEGRIVADSLTSALASLENEKLVVSAINVEDVLVVSEPAPEIVLGGAMSQEMVIERARELVPLFQALAAEIESREVRRNLLQLAQRLKHSTSLNDWVSDDLGTKALPLLIRYAATSQKAKGAALVIQGLVAPLEDRAADRRLLMYPLLMFLLTLVVFSFLSIVVVPIFREMFIEFDLPVPGITDFVLSAAEQITVHGLRTALVLCVVVVGVLLARRWIRQGDWSNRLLGRLVAGRTGNLAAMHRLTSVLAESMAAGLPIDESLRIAGQASRCFSYRRATEWLAIQGPGALTAENWNFASVLPTTMRQVMCMDLPQPAVIDVLREMAAGYLRRSYSSRIWLVTVFPVLLTVVMGIVVGVIVIALFAPLVMLVTGLS